MASLWPGSIDTFVKPVAGVDYLDSPGVNLTTIVDNLMDAVTALETHAPATNVSNTFAADGQTFIGTNPSTTTVYVNAASGQTSPIFQTDVDGSAKFRVAASGAVVGLGQTSSFGAGSFGAAQALTSIGDDGAGSALVKASHGTASTASLLMRPLGAAGNVALQDNGGATKFAVNSTGIGFFNTPPAAKSTVVGSRGGNAALASLLGVLSGLGLLTDGSSA